MLSFFPSVKWMMLPMLDFIPVNLSAPPVELVKRLAHINMHASCVCDICSTHSLQHKKHLVMRCLFYDSLIVIVSSLCESLLYSLFLLPTNVSPSTNSSE